MFKQIRPTVLACCVAGLWSVHANAEQPATTAEVYAAFYADPAKVLRYAHHNYQIVRSCHVPRRDMLVQYVAASALAQSRNDAKVVERALLDEHGDLNADAAWQAVTGRFGDVALMPDAGATDPISKLTVDTHRSMMMGNNGAERRTFFEGRVRDARRRQSVEKLRSICRLAIMNLRSDAVKFSKGAALESEKDF